MENIERNIIQEAAQGDQTAFHQIYQMTAGYVFALALKMAHNHTEAQDITQEVYIKVYTNLKDFRFASSLKTWLYRITINTALNYNRKNKLMARSGNVQMTPVLTGSQPARKDQYEQIANENLLTVFLSKLNPQQRACLILKELEGLSCREIADELHISINTVLSRLKRAKEKLVRLAQKRGEWK